VNSADVNSTQIAPTGAGVNENTDSVQLNGVAMNGHDDKPFRSLCLPVITFCDFCDCVIILVDIHT